MKQYSVGKIALVCVVIVSSLFLATKAIQKKMAEAEDLQGILPSNPRLSHLMEKSDRAIVALYMGAPMTVLEIEGDDLKRLIEGLEIKSTKVPLFKSSKDLGIYTACWCQGQRSIKFFRGNKGIMEIHILHDSWLRWVDGPWISDAELTLRSSILLERFFKMGGAPNLVTHNQSLEVTQLAGARSAPQL